MAPQTFNLLFSAVCKTHWHPLNGNATIPASIQSHPSCFHLCCATVCRCSILNVGKGDGVEGEGGLWLPLSNWLMTKASSCSWQAGDSSPSCADTLNWVESVGDGRGGRGCHQSARVLRRRLRLCTSYQMILHDATISYGCTLMLAGCICWRMSLRCLCDTYLWEERIPAGQAASNQTSIL